MDKIDKSMRKRMEENIYKARLKVLKIFVSSKEQQSKKMIIVYK